MLELSDLRINYGPVEAVKGVDLVVEDHGAVCLLGANGAGKTSTLRAISQLVRYEGEITFEGESLTGRKPESVARQGLIHVPEGRRVFSDLTVEENLQMGTTARERRRGWSLDDVYDLFPALRLLRRRSGHVLSGGEQQMVAIGRALVGAPRLLLLDEPSLGLAPSVCLSVFAALAEVKARCPILIVEQDTTRALDLATQAYVLMRGTVVASGPAEEMRDREVLLRSFLAGAADEPALGEDLAPENPAEPHGEADAHTA